MAPHIRQLTACVAQMPARWNWKTIKASNIDLAIFCDTNRFNWCAQYAHVILVENATRMQVHGTIQCRLSAKRCKYAIGTFAFDNLSDRVLQEKASLAAYLFNKLACHWQQIGTRREAFARLHCGYVWIDEHGLDARLVQRL